MKQYAIGCIIFGIIFSIIGLFISIAIGVAGGGAAILVGILLIIILGILPIYHGISEYKKDKRQNDKIIESKLTISNASDNDIKKLIDDYIERVVYNYNAQNAPTVSIYDVKKLFYSYCSNEIDLYKSYNDVNNRHFGIIAITLCCCIIISDNEYQSKKFDESLWFIVTIIFNNKICNDYKRIFFDTLDKSYLQLAIDNFESEDLSSNINFAQVLELAVHTFSKEHNLDVNLEVLKEICVKE